MFILQNSENPISLKGIIHIKAHSFTLINLILCIILRIFFSKTKEQYLWTFFVLPKSLHNLEKLNCFLNGSVKKNAVFFLVIKHKLILRVLNNIDWGDGFIQLLPLRTGSYSDWFSVGARCRCVHLTAVVRNFITDIYQNHTREPYTERFTHVCVVGTPDDGGLGPIPKHGRRSIPRALMLRILSQT